ncbi:MAG: hypothetical protein IJ567_06305 [Lachnospiraceae bacterium]|nr:hypothetical protein [Lachnospiraceae bacterium]
MSQAKVDRYKNEKRNRKKIMRREKAASVLRTSVVTLVAAAIVGWAGYSVVQRYQDDKPASYTDVNISAISDYLNNIGAD